jgi:hypothetical protein
MDTVFCARAAQCAVRFIYVLSMRIAADYRLDCRGSNPDRSKILLFSTKFRPALGPTQPPIQWIQGVISPRIKRQVCEADQSPASSAEVKNGVAIPSLPAYSSMA